MKQQTKIIALAILTVLIVGVVAGIAVYNRVNNTPDYYTSIDNPTKNIVSGNSIDVVSQETTSIQQENTSQPTENKKPCDNTHNDHPSNETGLITYTESPYEKIYVTTDHVSIEQKEYSGKIEIVVGVPYCNCTGTTKIYINGYYQGSGKNIGHLDWALDTFRHNVDLKMFEDGKLTIKVLGKHDEFINEFVIIVCSDDMGDIPNIDNGETTVPSIIEVFAHHRMDTNRFWFEPQSLVVSNIQQVNFFAPTDSYIVKYVWFKDGVLTSSTGESIGITSRTSYTVDLHITLDDGTVCGVNIKITILDIVPPVNTPPGVPTMSIPKTIDVGKEYTFYARASDANEDDTLWYSFDWGDGFVTIGSALQGKDISAKHTFTTPGIHILRVHVRDEYGGSNDAEFKVTVNKLPETNPDPTVQIDGPISCISNREYAYTAVTTHPEGHNLYYSFSWDDKSVDLYGPFPSGTEVLATHTWTEGDVYAVQVEVCDEFGFQSVKSDYLFVYVQLNSLPEVPTTPQGEVICILGETYTYTLVSSDSDGDSLWYAIDWGDGQTVEGPFEQGVPVQITHTWNHGGRYEMRYKANDGYGGISDWSASLFVIVLSPVDSLDVVVQYQSGTLSFDAESVTILNTQQVNFAAPLDIEVAEYEWYKNDVLISDDSSIGITSLTSYTLGLSITLTDGLSYSDSLLVTVIQ